MVISALSFVGLPRRRRGSVLPLVALTIVVQLSFLALAIDLGMVAISKTQAQQAADLVALTAARSLNGSATGNYNQGEATTNAQNILSYNRVLSNPIQASQLQLTYGSYDYSQSAQAFSANYPPLTGSPTTAVAATVTTISSPAAFSAIFGTQLLPTLSATAQAVHRPRDIALVMDVSGSMGFGSSLGFDMYAMTRTTNNPDTIIPTFGQYSSSSAVMIGPGTSRTSAYDSYTISPSNTTTANPSYTRTYVNSYYQNAAYASTLIRAFDSYTSTDGGNTWSPPSSGGPVLPPASYFDELLPRIRDNVARKGSYRRSDMHAVVHRYFADLQPVLAGVLRALRPGGRFVVVVGDSLLAGEYVPGDLILARMAERMGYRLVSVGVARTRRSGQRRNFLLRESVVSLERPRSSG